MYTEEKGLERQGYQVEFSPWVFPTPFRNGYINTPQLSTQDGLSM